MNNAWHRVAVAALLSGSLMAGPVMAEKGAEPPPSMEDLQQDILSLTEKLQDFGAEKHQEALAQLKKTLDELDGRIAELEKQLQNNWDAMSDQAREDAQQGLDELRDRRATLSRWYERLQGDSAEAWNNIQKDVEDAYKAFSEAWEERRQAPSNDSSNRQQSI
ncbi:hypothetical protein C8D92_101261 [Tamilnaduibacter salinus]|uniref:Uncharacterized protein n=1 Tax=Tamilnaduibacter salinus TaxID=1484056 RepID=A0A2A2I084_9GAMM|nr:hypothetical protein [Tamilnaduibacter salinus]PAV24694.1 hypothetical protein CF392_14870 [Tamilnaduibacter salinus]PVY79055.1 hypothetical protein C8D92_101261 [Tamilnaduibacter salinus]